MWSKKTWTTVCAIFAGIAAILGIIVDLPEALAKMLEASPDTWWMIAITICVSIVIACIWIPWKSFVNIRPLKTWGMNCLATIKHVDLGSFLGVSKGDRTVDVDRLAAARKLLLDEARAESQTPEERRLEVTRSLLLQQANDGSGIETQAKMRDWMEGSDRLIKDCLKSTVRKHFHRYFTPQEDQPLRSIEQTELKKSMSSLRGIASRLRLEHLRD